MEYFIYTIIVLVSIAILSKVMWIADGIFPVRTFRSEVWDVFINLLLIIWAIILLII